MRRSILILALLLTAVAAPGASAQKREVPESRAQAQLSFAPIVKQAAPAVVNVFAARHDKRAQNPGMDEFLRRFFGENRGGRPEGPGAPGPQSLGSGVIVDPSGLVITNHHVIEGMNEVKAVLADRREFEAEIVLRDPRTDLAVLRLKGQGPFQSLEFGDSEALEVGDLVLAIGNPFGVGQTVTSGIVSALARTQVGISDYQFFIQTDAAINPGNSGGALVDTNGKLIGINTAIFSRTGGSHGIGFAIPASMVKTVATSAQGGNRTVRRPWLGARLQNVTPEVSELIGLERPGGVLVASVQDKSPAQTAGLKRGDVIVAIEGQDVSDPESFGYRFALRGIEGEAKLTVLRAGKRTDVPVKLAAAPETRPRDPVKVRNRSPFSGVTAVNLSPAVAEELSLDMSGEGVVLADIEDNSAASRVGFRRGDFILAVNGERVGASKDLERIVRRGAQVWEITIGRDGRVFTSVFGG